MAILCAMLYITPKPVLNLLSLMDYVHVVTKVLMAVTVSDNMSDGLREIPYT